jgi:hypothetical protein
MQLKSKNKVEENVNMVLTLFRWLVVLLLLVDFQGSSNGDDFSRFQLHVNAFRALKNHDSLTGLQYYAALVGRIRRYDNVQWQGHLLRTHALPLPDFRRYPPAATGISRTEAIRAALLHRPHGRDWFRRWSTTIAPNLPDLKAS